MSRRIETRISTTGATNSSSRTPDELSSKKVISFDSTRPDFAPYGLTCARWMPVPMKRPDRHNEIELNLLKQGTLTYLMGGSQVTIKAGRLVAFWAAIPHQIIDSTGQTDYFVVTIPLVWFLQCQFPESFVHPILHGQVLADPGQRRVQADLGLFESWSEDLKHPDLIQRRIAKLEIEARLLRFAAAVPRASSGSKARGSHVILGAGGLSRVEQMASFIARHYTEPLTAEQIGQAVQLHPNYAMTLFKSTFGATINDCITQHRVTHAQRLLVTTDEKIVEVAFASGFNSISRFNEAFKDLCGCSPRQYRDKHRALV